MGQGLALKRTEEDGTKRSELKKEESAKKTDKSSIR
jgi:hypothetical protein